jgi:uncharacterized protein YndB with AHSA1/START domain
MWTHAHTVETELPPEAIWQVLSDIDGWTSWDTSMEQIKLLGPFAVGTEISMTPKGQDPVRSTIVAIEPNQLYVDEVGFGDLTLRFTHTLTRLDPGGTRLTHQLTISGPAADEAGPTLGPQITEDFPEAMAALVAAADAQFAR